MDYESQIVRRARNVLLLLVFALVGLIVRLAWIQLVQHEEYKELAFRQHWTKKTLPAERGKIYDRNGRLLALSIDGYSCYADPRMVKDHDEAAERLSPLLQMEKEVLFQRISNSKRRFVWLKRLLAKETADQIKSLKIAGVGFQKEPKRVYPQGKLGAHLIGFVSADNQGLEGIEASFNQELSGQNGFKWALKDGRMASTRIYDPYAPNLPPKHGADIHLTIDTVFQHFVEEELDKAMHEYQAGGAAAVLLDVRNGEIMAMASRPTYDPNEFKAYPPESWRNRALCDAYELGSVMKPLVIASAFSEKLVTPDTPVDCGKGACRIIPGRVLHDSHPYGILSVTDVIVKSSNIGTAKIGMLLGPEKICHYLDHLGIGRKTGIELPGESPGILKPPSKWTNFTLTSVPMGHEVCATPLQMVSAYLPLAGEGIRWNPTLIGKVVYPDGNVTSRYPDSEIKRIYPTWVTDTMKSILREVVEKGTARKANVKEVTVSGKTGTAQKIDKSGGYSQSEYIAVFVGFAPSEKPIFCAIVMVDTPKGIHSGGGVCAPIVGTILRNCVLHQQWVKDKSVRPF